MGLLGKITNKTRQGILGTRQVIADGLKQGRERSERTTENINNFISNIENDHPIAATTLRTIKKCSELTEKPFRKMNKYLYNKIKPPTTEASATKNTQEESDAEYIRNHFSGKRIIPSEYIKINQEGNKNEI